MTARLDFHGCYTAIVTPFTADGSAVDLTRLEEGVRRQAAGGVTGIVPCGTTGESPTLSEEEHARVVETAVRVGRAARLQVVAGGGATRPRMPSTSRSSRSSSAPTRACR
jgi:4-hydroxy-tetrahydrodipicolinate synthase